MLIRLADRKGILRGDLHFLQDQALLWLLGEDFNIKTEIEKERMKYTLLASNPQLYDQLYNEDEEELDDSDVEWMVPESKEEFDEIMDFLNNTRTQRESGV